MRRHLFPVLVVAGVVSLVGAGTSLAQSVGSAAAVNPEATGTPPGGALRTMRIGTEVVANELISTGSSGSMQIMFLDMTTLTVGPNSDLVIDRFVFDPNQSTGEFTARLTKGALRFVGGAVSHNNVATISTPTATIGIRGGGGMIQFLAKCDKKDANTFTTDPSKGCTRVACTLGTCTVSPLDRPFNELVLRVNQAVDVGNLGLQPVTLQDNSTQNLTRSLTTGQGGEEGDPELKATDNGPQGNQGPPLNVQQQAENAAEIFNVPAPPPPGGIGGGGPPAP